MKTKLFTFLFAIIVSIGKMLAYDEEIDGLYYYIYYEEKTAWVEGYAQCDVMIDIPASIYFNEETYSVTSIGDGAFFGCTSLTSVTIPNSVTSIGDRAFSGCTGLTDIDVATDNPNYCSINGVLFNKDKTTLILYPGNKGGTYVIPNSVTSIGRSAFYDCTGLTSVTLPNSVTSIGEYAFAKCASLTTVIIPNSVTSIGSYAFWSCRGLTSVNIPNSVTSIGNYAFMGCTSFTSVTIPNSVTSIGDGAFSGVANIIYEGAATGSPWGARSINGYVDGCLFYQDESKTVLLACSPFATGGLIIPNSVTSIGNYAFENCTSLTSVTIPNSVTSIGYEAFSGCSSLASVTIPSSVTSIENYAFSGCSNLTTVVWNARKVRPIKDGNFNFFRGSPIRSLTIGEDVDSIPTIIRSGELDTLIWKPKGYMYYSIAFPERNPFYGDNCRIKYLLFGDKVEYIPSSFFVYQSIKSVDIPNSVKGIGWGAFERCYDLQSVIIGNGVTYIGSGAFMNCSIETIIIGNSVNTIATGAFKYAWSGDRRDISITCYAETPPTTEDPDDEYAREWGPFDEWTKGAAGINVYVPANSVEAYKNADGWKNQHIYPIGATPTTTTGITINPSDYYVDISWLSTPDATSYELVVLNKNGDVVCRVIFDKDGILQSITFQFDAPARHRMSQQTQGAGFIYTLIGLDSGTEYDVTITAKNANGATLNVQTISFTTNEDGIENSTSQIDRIEADKVHNAKIMRDGHLLILRGEHLFNAQGARVK